jgi:UDP-glucose:(glucosyl)LPS alpha-1,2-glucosyltransferase
MTAIIDGELFRNELARHAMGGTELMAMRMIRCLDPVLLKRVNIVHQRVDDDLIDNGKPTILVLHDLPHDGSSQHLRDPKLRDRFALITPVSNWQAQMYNAYLGVPYERMRVMYNWTDPLPAHEAVDAENPNRPIKLVYHTTPHRGLEILLPVFCWLAESVPNVELHLYSSFKIYGWDERDAPYKELFKRADEHPRIFNHGTVTNEVIRNTLSSKDIYAYPSIWPECHSLAMIEAMLAGCTIVTDNFASLPETCMGFAYMADYSENYQMLMDSFAPILKAAVDDHRFRHSKVKALNDLQVQHAMRHYTSDVMVAKWHRLIAEVLANH